MTKLTDELVQAARRIEAESGIDAAVLLAVAAAETNGVAYALFEGRREPLIRFEGHYFDRLLPPEKRAPARSRGLADPKAGRIRNPAAQSARWRLLDKAAAIDPAAAYCATSWGLGQVMGAHWKALGFGSPAALAAEARRSVDGQLAIVARFLKAEQIDRLLPQGAFAAFARRYNGPGYAANRYDAKIEAAYAAVLIALGALGGEGTVSKGWHRSPAMLLKPLSWLSNLPRCVPTPMRSSSTSTERSSVSATIRPTSASPPPPWRG